MIWAGGTRKRECFSRTFKNDTKKELFGRILSLYLKECVDLDELH